MKIFKDRNGVEWTIDINVDAIKRVRALLDVNLLAVVEGKLIERLTEDPVLLVDVIYVLCQPDAQKRSVTDEQFGRAMGGEAIDRATTSFFEELTDFFPSGKRTILKAAMAKIETLQGMALASMTTRLNSGELEAQMQSLLTPAPPPPLTPSASSGSLPASSASTPADSRSDN